MPLNRSYFLLFSAGYSCSVLHSKLVILWVDENKQRVNIVLYISWLIYIALQTLIAWIDLEDDTYKASTIALGISTFFYNVSICSILYMSMSRILVLYPGTRQQRITQKLLYPLVGILFAIRTARSIMILVRNLGTSVFPQSNIMHVITLFPILVVRNFYDMLALNAVIKMKQLAQSIRAPKEGKYENNRALKTLALNLSMEIFLSVFSLGVSTVEAFSYEGNMVSYVDWLMISWALGSAIEQKQIYRTIFRSRSGSEISDIDQAITENELKP